MLLPTGFRSDCLKLVLNLAVFGFNFRVNMPLQWLNPRCLQTRRVTWLAPGITASALMVSLLSMECCVPQKTINICPDTGGPLIFAANGLHWSLSGVAFLSCLAPRDREMPGQALEGNPDESCCCGFFGGSQLTVADRGPRLCAYLDAWKETLRWQREALSLIWTWCCSGRWFDY